MTDRMTDDALDELLALVAEPEPRPDLAARILASAPKPQRGLSGALAAVLAPGGRRWPAGAALASLAVGLSAGYAAAQQGVAVSVVEAEYGEADVYEALGFGALDLSELERGA